VTILEPTVIMKFGFTPSINIGYIPQQITWGVTPILKIGFLPKLETTWLPYDPDDIVVTGGTPAVTISPPSSSAAAQSGTIGVLSPDTAITTATTNVIPATPVVSGLVRPHTPKLTGPTRISPSAFAKKGLTIDLFLDQEAAVTASVVASYKTDGKGKAKPHTVSRVTTDKLGVGARTLILHATKAGEAEFAKLGRVSTKVEVTFAYADKTKITLTHALTIAAGSPPLKVHT
jgi:hypothetical protein